MISKLRNGDFRYVFKSKDTIYQVDKYGINIHGEQVVKNKLSTVSENEINGYLLFDKNTYPIFVSREYVSIVDLKNYFALPCFSLSFLEIIVLISIHVVATVAWFPLQLRYDLIIALHYLKLCV